MESNVVAVPEAQEYIAVSRGVKYGASIREAPPAGGSHQEPDDLHLIYISMGNAQLIVRHMRKLDFKNSGTLEEAEKFLVREARKATPPRVGQFAQDFARMEFQRASYFTLVVDSPGWEFYYPMPTSPAPVPGELHDPLVFIEKKRELDTSAAKNFAFYNAVPVYPEGTNGFRCTNFFTTEAGTPIIGTLDYKFEVYIMIPFSPTFTLMEPGFFGRHITIIIDPDGQNQGP